LITNSTSQAIDRWVDQVAEWLEVYAKIDARPYRPEDWHPIQHVDRGPMIIRTDGSLDYFPARISTGTTSFPTSGQPKISGGVLSLASRTAKTCPRSIATCAMRGRHKAVSTLHAPSSTQPLACEVALSTSIRSSIGSTLNDATPESVDRLLNASALMALVDLYGVVGAQPLRAGRNKIRKQVAETRNRAVHAGIAATSDELNEALALVDQLVNDLSPLP
jgi:hypothetical protein